MVRELQCGGTKDGFGFFSTGSSNLSLLKERLAGTHARRFWSRGLGSLDPELKNPTTTSLHTVVRQNHSTDPLYHEILRRKQGMFRGDTYRPSYFGFGP